MSGVERKLLGKIRVTKLSLNSISSDESSQEGIDVSSNIVGIANALAASTLMRLGIGKL